MSTLLARPRLLGLICASIAAALGAAYMLAAGAPAQYPLVNLGALLLGALLFHAMRRPLSRLPSGGAAVLALSGLLLATALFGAAVEGASRWILIGPFSLQPSLILLPGMIVLFARAPDRLGALGLAVAALALALQPVRGMAGVLAASLLALAAARRGPATAAAAAAAGLALPWTLLRPDTLPAVPYVDRILFTSFGVHPLAGAGVVLGALGLALPAFAALRRQAEPDRPALLAFGVCWTAVVAAAALGNYPTPVVGYGAASVLGYLLSTALLPPRVGAAARGDRAATPPGADRETDLLRTAATA